MMRILLQRGHSTDQGTFGRLSASGFSCFTGELPWRDNKTGLSCIPAGEYRFVWALSPRFRRHTYRAVAVPGRSGVLIHSANLMGDKEKGFVAQLEGCISLGDALGKLNGQAALLVSKPAVRRFEDLLNKQDFILEVHDA